MRMLNRKLFKRLFLGWMALNVVLLIAYWPLVKQLVKFSPIIMPVRYSAPENTADAQMQDIRHLRRILRYDRSFSVNEKQTFNQHIDSMESQNGKMGKAAFYLAVRRAMAIAENGHTNASMRPVDRDFNTAGIHTKWFADGLHIVKAHNSRSDLIGARIIDIEGHTAEEIVQKLGLYIGGVSSWKRLYSQTLLRSPDLMHAAGITASPDVIQVSIVDANGTQRDVSLSALAPIAISETNNWSASLDLAGPDLSLYLKNIDDNFFRSDIAGGTYLRASVLFDRNGMEITEKLRAVVDDAPANGYAFIVFDLRTSPGGDFGTVADFAKTAQTIVRPNGKIYVITGPQTFSAAIVSTALFKRFAAEKTIIVGEPMGDTAQFWAERGMSYQLPNSQIYINYATGYHDWEKGCTGTHPYCFSRNSRHDGKIVSLKPDMIIAPSYDDYASGRDIVMDWVRADASIPERLK